MAISHRQIDTAKNAVSPLLKPTALTQLLDDAMKYITSATKLDNVKAETYTSVFMGSFFVILFEINVYSWNAVDVRPISKRNKE